MPLPHPGTPRPRPRTVVFDIGGVLIDWNPRHLYRKLFRDDAAGMEYFLTEICSPAWNLEQDRGRPWDIAVAELSARFPNHADLIAAYPARWDEMVTGPIPGTADIMARLEDSGVPLYCITNFAVDKLTRAQKRFPELTRFRGIAISGELGLIKPDPAIYRHLIDQYRLDARDCLFIDDVPANVQGAKAVGMDAVQFTGAAQLARDLQERGLL